ncbi:MAG TPA: branched-chain amino acid ABC transporter permease [Hyphomicrobiaceae bacterium]|nr:branched-chain amino acid ABC transporter permease [Hyphomicrobiaceae bacterium]
MLLQQLLNGVLASGIYALFAVGFTMIFGIMGVLNMAHADLAVVAAFAIIWAVSAGFSPLPAVLIAVVATLALALLVERLAMRPGRRFKGEAAIEMPLIATIGAGMIIQNVAALLFGNKVIFFPWQLPTFVNVGGFLVSQGLLISAGVALVLLVALEILVDRTSFGRQIRAVAQNPTAAKIMGIDTNLVIVSTVALTAAIAGMAGGLVGLSYGFVAPLMGIPYAIKGLVAMIIGGVGSLRGAVLGALLIGLVEAMAVTWFGSQVKDVAVFAVLLAVLAVKPGGLIATPGAR